MVGTIDQAVERGRGAGDKQDQADEAKVAEAEREPAGAPA